MFVNLEKMQVGAFLWDAWGCWIIGKDANLSTKQQSHSFLEVYAGNSNSTHYSHDRPILPYLLALLCITLPYIAFLPYLALFCHTLPILHYLLAFFSYLALLCHILPSCHILPYFALLCPVLHYLLAFLPYLALLCHTLPHFATSYLLAFLPYLALICHILPYLAISYLTLPYLAFLPHLSLLGSILVLCSNCSGPFYELHQIVSVQIQRSTLILPYLLSDSLQAASCQFRNEGEEEGSGLDWPGSMEWGSEMADVHCCTPLWTALHGGNIYPAMPCYLSLCNQKVKSDQFAPQRQNIAKL